MTDDEVGKRRRETEEDNGSYRRNMKIEIDSNDSLSIEHKEEIHTLSSISAWTC